VTTSSSSEAMTPKYMTSSSKRQQGSHNSTKVSKWTHQTCILLD